MKRGLIIFLMGISICMLAGCQKNNTEEPRKNVSVDQNLSVTDNTGEVDENENQDDIVYVYEVLDDGTLSVQRFSSDAVHKFISVPSEIDGKTVSEVGGALFKNDDDVKKVVLPDTVTRIGEDTFYYTSSMKELIINGHVTYVGMHGIYGCDSLKALTFKDGLTELDENAVAMCKDLSDIYLPETVENINIANFYGCADSLRIHVPKNSTVESMIKDMFAESETTIEIISE